MPSPIGPTLTTSRARVSWAARSYGPCPCSGAPDAAYHFVVELENTGSAYRFAQSGVFERPDDGPALGPIGPGEFFRFSFTARPGDRTAP